MVNWSVDCHHIDIQRQGTIPHFIPQLANQLVVDDARHYLLQTNKNYDVIINDAYSDIKAIPAHLLTKEYMQLVKARLHSSGIAIFNVVANPQFRDAYSKRIDRTIRTVFDCTATPTNFANQITNIIYTCYPPLEVGSGIYSDNLNQSTTDAFAMLKSH